MSETQAPSRNSEEMRRLVEQTKAAIAATGKQTKDIVFDDVRHAAEETFRALGETDEITLNDLTVRVFQDLLGYGPLQKFLDDDTVTEIMVNAHDDVYVERDGTIEPVDERVFEGEGEVLRLIDRIATRSLRRCDAANPIMDARLEDGSRVNAIIEPITRFGAALTIRKFPRRRLTMDDLIANGTLSYEMARFLKGAVESRCNILVSGGTGTGKTTMLNVLAGFIPLEQRVITIEDTAELQLPVKNWVSMEARTKNTDGQGEVTIHQLVVASMRMRPDRIIVGECRSDEAVEMLQAMNTGHDGSFTTVHANDTRSAFMRIEDMVMRATNLKTEAIDRLISAAINLVVQVTRFSDGSRRVTEVLALTGDMEGDTIVTTPLFEWQPQYGYHAATGNSCPARIVERFNIAGAEFDPTWFADGGYYV